MSYLARGLMATLFLTLGFGCGDDATADMGDAAADTRLPDDATPDALADAAPDALADAAPDGGPCAAPTADIVHFDTEDGVTLEADLYAQASAGTPAVVLLHMIPPSNDRTNYPSAFIDAAYCAGFTVLNVDRRGGGGSTGNFLEAYEGPNGVNDARAAVAHLLALPEAPSSSALAIVGASNGTTTLLDYATRSVTTDATPTPAALVYLSGGVYTTNQNMLDVTTLGFIPSLFVYPTAEAPWNDGVAATAPAAWTFETYAPGAHGTGVFATNPPSIARVVDFLSTQLTP